MPHEGRKHGGTRVALGTHRTGVAVACATPSARRLFLTTLTEVDRQGQIGRSEPQLGRRVPDQAGRSLYVGRPARICLTPPWLCRIVALSTCDAEDSLCPTVVGLDGSVPVGPPGVCLGRDLGAFAEVSLAHTVRDTAVEDRRAADALERALAARIVSAHDVVALHRVVGAELQRGRGCPVLGPAENRRPAFDHQYAEPGFDQRVGGHGAAHAAADDHDVISHRGPMVARRVLVHLTVLASEGEKTAVHGSRLNARSPRQITGYVARRRRRPKECPAAL